MHMAFGPKQKKVIVVRVKLRNEELEGLYLNETLEISRRGSWHRRGQEHEVF